MTALQYIRQVGTALSVAATIAACTTTDNKNATLAQDTTLSRDLNLARRDSAAQPQLRDVPAPAAAPAPAPRSTATTASGNSVSRNDPAMGATGAGGGTVGTIPSGTSIDLASNQRVCTNTAPGTAFTARTTAPVSAGGVTVPAGATANVSVTDSKRSNNANDPIVMTLAVSSLTWGGKTYPINSEVTYVKVDQVRDASKTQDIEKVVGGAVVGAAIGQILGHNTKSTVIGAATGAAAGTAIAMGTAGTQGCIPEGGRISIKLTSPTTVRAE
ncbi:MAG: hypothetical protein NVS4B3_10070 [Gemmatimonadaceae bacterium]